MAQTTLMWWREEQKLIFPSIKTSISSQEHNNGFFIWLSHSHVAISSTSELNTKLGKVVVMSLPKPKPKNKRRWSRTLESYCLSIHVHMLIPYLKYGRVITFNNDGFLETKFCHSILSIFPSWFTSASKKVYPHISKTKTKRYSMRFKGDCDTILGIVFLIVTLLAWNQF